MIIECNGQTTEEKLKSLQESVQRALNNVGNGGSASSLGTLFIKSGGQIGGVIDGKYVVIKNLNADNITAGNIAADRIQAAFIDSQGAKIIDLETETINGHKILNGSVVADALANSVVTLFSDTSVYYNSEMPTGTEAKPLKEGDLWYKTVGASESEASNVYVWDGEEWVEKTLDATMFTAGTITAREIAAGTITATQLAANTISADKLTIGLNNTIESADEDINGTVTYEYEHIVAGETVTEKVYKDNEGKYFYKTSGDNEVEVSYSDLKKALDTQLPVTNREEDGASYQIFINQGEIESLAREQNEQAQIISSQLDPTNGDVYQAIRNASLILRNLVELSSSGIKISNIEDSSNYMLLTSAGLDLVKGARLIASITDFEGKGTFNADVARISTLKMRSEGTNYGKLGWVAQSNGHLSLKEVY